jgi:hypothetical protein
MTAFDLVGDAVAITSLQSHGDICSLFLFVSNDLKIESREAIQTHDFAVL